MTKSKLTALLGLLIAPFGFESAFGHHSFEGVFDGSRTVDVEGVVKEFRLVNPHAMMTLEVANDQGRKELRTIEFDGLLNLTVGGWTSETIRPGERVMVHGNPARSGNGRVWFLSLTRADGTKLERPFNARTNAIDEQRRQRARQQDRQQ
jgi:Family of unknown function (DUF6152)